MMYRRESKLKVSNRVDNILILLKNDNQKSIVLAQNSIFDFRTKQIDIQHHYIWNEVAS